MVGKGARRGRWRRLLQYFHASIIWGYQYSSFWGKLLLGFSRKAIIKKWCIRHSAAMMVSLWPFFGGINRNQSRCSLIKIANSKCIICDRKYSVGLVKNVVMHFGLHFSGCRNTKSKHFSATITLRVQACENNNILSSSVISVFWSLIMLRIEIEWGMWFV